MMAFFERTKILQFGAIVVSYPIPPTRCASPGTAHTPNTSPSNATGSGFGGESVTEGKNNLFCSAYDRKAAIQKPLNCPGLDYNTILVS